MDERLAGARAARADEVGEHDPQHLLDRSPDFLGKLTPV
jgi:hypothetical protein